MQGLNLGSLFIYLFYLAKWQLSLAIFNPGKWPGGTQVWNTLLYTELQFLSKSEHREKKTIKDAGGWIL